MAVDVQPLRDWIEAHLDELVQDTRDSIRIASTKAPAAGPGAPFGTAIRDVLVHALGRAEAHGLSVANLDGYAGHAEFGTGAEMVAALGHLDVVPAGSGWVRGAFAAELEDGVIYGRGALDDKGPIWAALYGAIAVKACGIPLARRVRIILGCDEESGFGCMAHYFGVAAQERPVLGFTPDADFPLVYAEKGISTFVLQFDRTAVGDGPRVASMSAGLRANMVPSEGIATVSGTPEALAAAEARLARYWDANVACTAEGGSLTVRSTGRSAHGSTPTEGDNAAVRLARALREICPGDAPWLSWMITTGDPAGSGLAIEGRDAVVGPLTCNLGVASVSDEHVRLTYNVRCPVEWNAEDLFGRLERGLEDCDWSIAERSFSAPLYVPLDKEPVNTLLRVYRELTGDVESRPLTMGGGTYARATPGIVAYGAYFPGSSDGPVHEPEECISVRTLADAAVVYAVALAELANLP